LKRLINETWTQHIPAYSQNDYKADKILQHIVSRQQQGPLSPDSQFPSFRLLRPIIHRLRNFPYIGYAAALALVPLITFLLHYSHRATARFHHALATTVSVPVATDSCLTLPDGSKVLLHKDAHIDYADGLAGKNREVKLYGEAYFDIRKDSRPFIVHTGPITTTVLGTAFNIDAHDRQTITITVTKGKVKVENGAGEVSILRRNEQISVDSLHTRLKKVQVDAGQVLAWKKPYLLFNDVTMKEAMQELEQRYHVMVVFTNTAAENCPVTASFTSHESLEEIINVLSKINNMEFTIRQRTVEISGDGCN